MSGEAETTVTVRRLTPEDATAVVDCFRRVYGGSYANELFYDPVGLASAMRGGSVGCVGAFAADDQLLGHMAMTVRLGANVVELGNTVVDPAARGAGLAWKVGAELSAWCRELGYQGFLHYPTTDHHIMQRQSVRAGFETGLMLGYIPAETYGQVGDDHCEPVPKKRQAATIVYEPYSPGAAFEGYLPADYAELLKELIPPTGLLRDWQPSAAERSGSGESILRRFGKRGLERLEVKAVGNTLNAELAGMADGEAACLQIDFSLGDPAIDAGVRLARAQGFRFCGWLPGFRAYGDVLRLQRVEEAETDLAPRLENPVARRLLEIYLSDR